ncbi:MAG: hypothetical protein HUU38_01720 [Anaerolineales bacterium]|nr:hypothetical protein [Anaerolineales bacterium]
MQANDTAWYPSISGDGRYIAYYSHASNLVANDTNGEPDVFVHDRQTGETIRVSVASDGTEANDFSDFPRISANGRYVAFGSYASNLVNGDTNGSIDAFVYDLATTKITRVSVASDGSEGNAGLATGVPTLSAEGRYVVFASVASNLVEGDTNEYADIFVHDQENHETTRVSLRSDGGETNGASYRAVISGDGRYVAFSSEASNLVEGDDNNFCDTNFDRVFTDNCADVFVHDRQTGITTLVSATADGSVGNHWSVGATISADGRFVAFYSVADDFFPGDQNFLCDVNFNGVFDENCPDVFVWDRDTGSLRLASATLEGAFGNDMSWYPALSADGHFLAFASFATDLVEGDTNDTIDVFVLDMESGKMDLVSRAWDGAQSIIWGSQYPALSTTGRFVAFHSGASNLVQGDTNFEIDVFVRDLQPYLFYFPLITKPSE